MSKFYTPISVPVQQVIDALPAGASRGLLIWNPATNCLEVHWEHPDLVTPYTFALPFTVEQMATAELPEKAFRRVRPIVVAPPVTGSNPAVTFNSDAPAPPAKVKKPRRKAEPVPT